MCPLRAAIQLNLGNVFSTSLFKSVNSVNSMTFTVLLQLTDMCSTLQLYFADASDNSADCSANCVKVDFDNSAVMLVTHNFLLIVHSLSIVKFFWVIIGCNVTFVLR